MADSPVPRIAGPFLKVTLQLTVTALVTWFLLKAVGLRLDEVLALDPSQWRPAWVILVLASVGLLLAYVFTAGLWGTMVRELGGPRMAFLASCRVFFTANLGRYIPGKLWQVAGLAYLARGEGVAAWVAVAAALLGQALALVGATVIGLPILLRGEWGLALGGAWVVAAILALLALVMVPGVLRRAMGVWFRLAKGELPGDWNPRPGFGLRWAALYAIGWAAQGTAFWGLARSLGLELDLALGASAYAAAYLLGYLMLPAPAGLGVREGFLVLFLEPALGPAVAPLAIIARLWTTLVELAPALALAGGYLRKDRKGVARGG